MRRYPNARGPELQKEARPKLTAWTRPWLVLSAVLLKSWMNPRRVGSAVVAIALLISLSPAAAATVTGAGAHTPFLVSPDLHAQYPAVAVDNQGTGYFAWNSYGNGISNDPFHYCRIPRGATHCDVTKTFHLRTGYAGNWPQILLPEPGEVVLTTFRCCQAGTYAIISHDGGRTFGPPHIIGNLGAYQTTLGPGTGTVSIIDGPAVTEGIGYQAASLAGPTTTAYAHVGQTTAGVMPYLPALGFTDVNTPIVAFVDVHEDRAYFRVWSGNGDVNDASSWGDVHSLGAMTDLHMASGIKGLVLMGQIHLDNPSRYIYVIRRWDPVRQAFGPARNLSDPSAESYVGEGSIVETTDGNLVAIFASNRSGDGEFPVEYRVSKDGGLTWLPERTWVSNDGPEGNLVAAAGPDGSGYIVWKDAHGIRAVAIPAVSSLAGGGPDPNCPQSLRVGSAQALAVTGCFKKGTKGQFTATGAVRFDGLDLYPDTAGKIVINTLTQAVTGSNVETLAGNVVLDNGSFNWSLGGGGPVATFDNLGSFHDSIFGFGVTGDASLSFAKGVATIPVHLQLPGIFGGVTGDMTLTLKNPGGLELKQLHIHVNDAFLGLLEVKNLDVNYQGGEPPSLEGKATFLLPPTYSEPGVDVGFGFSAGEFKHAEGAFPLTLPLFPPFLYLQKIGLALSTDPLTIKGGVDLSGGPQILGGSAIDIDALPADGGGFTLSLGNPADFNLSGKMSVVGIPFADGFVDYKTSGLLTFGGGVDFTLPLDVANIEAEVPETAPLGPGFLDLSSGKFNAPLSGHVCVPAGCDVIDIGAQGVISSTGIAACGQYILYQGPPGPTVGVSAGFGYRWGQGPKVFADLGGCDVSSYAASMQARLADASTHDVVTVGAGLPQENIVVQGSTAAPQITVTAPNGETVSSAVGSAAKSKHMLVFSDPAAKRTYVLIGEPPAGRYTIDTQTGSPTITSVRHADGLPAPRVTVAVTGTGSTRSLTYDVLPIAGQTVTFAERASGVAGIIGSSSGASGKITFTPAAGPKGKRQIVAEVQENGVPRTNIVVASYIAPPQAKLPPPKFVHVKRAHGGVTVTWAKVSHAAHYAVHIQLSDGRDEAPLLGPKAQTFKIPAVAASIHGSVSVRALAISGLRGKRKTAKIAARPATKV